MEVPEILLAIQRELKRDFLVDHELVLEFCLATVDHGDQVQPGGFFVLGEVVFEGGLLGLFLL